MYATSAAALADIVAERRSRQAEVRARVDEFLERTYGVRDCSALFEQHFRFADQKQPVGVLARQIASVCSEDVAFDIVAHSLRLSPVTATFADDTFSLHNHDKKSRAKAPFIEWSKSGNMVMKYEQISQSPLPELEGKRLGDIACEGGVSLVEHHRALRARIGLDHPTPDVSSLHVRMLEQARHRPSFVYRKGERDTRCAISTEGILQQADRPPAEWYYPYYLCWFLDGSAVLFETYDNPEGGVPEAKRLFEKFVERIVSGTGFAPIIAKVPPLTKDMLYCNRHLLAAGRSGLTALREKTSSITDDDITARMRAVADEVIAFR